jgi:hypothetical protein
MAASYYYYYMASVLFWGSSIATRPKARGICVAENSYNDLKTGRPQADGDT